VDLPSGLRPRRRSLGRGCGAAARGLGLALGAGADAKAIFHAVFAEAAAEDFAPLVAALDFSRARVVADLGGGGGGLLAAVLAARPEVRGILVERQGAIDGASKRFEMPGLKGRCELVAGDLLESIPSGADVYLMRCVLHGYDDASAVRILRNVRGAMGPRAASSSSRSCCRVGSPAPTRSSRSS
jgi:hypothetical protein